jgi:aerobic carbon-monoxide dehydrogenase medium subunit
MVSAPFAYTRVISYDAAVQALSDYGEDAKLLAGGQSLLPMLNLRLVRPTAVIDINAVDAREPYLDDGRLVLPALTPGCSTIPRFAATRRC